MPLVPFNLLRWMSKEDRKKYAKGQLLPEELEHASEVATEKELHEQIFALLGRREVPYVHAPMFKASALPPGYPDFSFLYHGVGLGIECKVGKGKIKPHQAQMHERMRKQGWRIFEIHSLLELQQLLDSIDESFDFH